MINLKESLGECQEKLLRDIGSFSKDTAYLVGGPVRDILLGRDVFDLDIMIQGDAISLVKDLYKQEVLSTKEDAKKPILFKKYRTAKLRFANEICPGISVLDFASVRKENYSSIGAAPECELGGFEEDLLRRDFSINAMAVSLHSENYETLYDLHSGRKDLEVGLIRILHEKSFHDDPARMIRAVRFMKRFGFSLEPETESLFKQAIEKKYLSFLPKKRAYSELAKVLAEPDSQTVFFELQSCGALEQIDAELSTSSISKIEMIIKERGSV